MTRAAREPMALSKLMGDLQSMLFPFVAGASTVRTTRRWLIAFGVVGALLGGGCAFRAQAAEPPAGPPANRLAKENSPYLLQHAHNPVDWYPWGDEAFARAKKEGRPVFLSIGYAACHWCHVMERESF